MNNRNWLIEYRQKKGLSQEKLAELVGITQQAYSQYENGGRRPSVETAKKIAEILEFEWTKFYE